MVVALRRRRPTADRKGKWVARSRAHHDGVPPSPRPSSLATLLRVAVVAAVGLSSIRCGVQPADPPSRVLPPEPAPQLAEWEGPSDDYFPCSDCHEDEPTDRSVRDLEFEHDDISLAHGDLWCLHCHEADDRDRLHLADESTIGFQESWRLCTQCHGQKLADWRAGVHGKRVGHWWGEKEYQTCVSCHRPHAPRFRSLEPRPPPLPPSQIVRTPAAPGEEAHE